VVGLCVTARNEDLYQKRACGWDDDGRCTAIGHKRTLNASGAAFINGTAAHGEDFDDTFEGGPVHAGAVVVPAVLAACERHNPDGRMALIGIAVGTEVLCRLSLVVPKAVHKAGFSPDRDLRRDRCGGRRRRGAGPYNARQIVDALGIRRQHGGRPSSNIWLKVHGPSGYMRAGRLNRHSGGVAGAAGVLSARARYWRACMGCSTALRIRPKATTRR